MFRSRKDTILINRFERTIEKEFFDNEQSYKNKLDELEEKMAKNKMKSHRGAMKRFKVTGTGKIKRNKAYKSHILNKKSAKRKRGLRKATVLTSADLTRMRRAMGK